MIYLLTRMCERKDIDHDWLHDRCMEVQNDPDGYIDLWARGHYKTSIITIGLTVQYFLNNPQATVGIFSSTANAARIFCQQIEDYLGCVMPDLFDYEVTRPKAYMITEQCANDLKFDLIIYDEIAADSYTNLGEVFQHFKQSLNSLKDKGVFRGVGSCFGHDIYKTIEDLGLAKIRKHPATADGTPDGEPVLHTREKINQLRSQMGSLMFSHLMLIK